MSDTIKMEGISEQVAEARKCMCELCVGLLMVFGDITDDDDNVVPLTILTDDEINNLVENIEEAAKA